LSSAAAFETAPNLRIFLWQHFKPLMSFSRIDDEPMFDADHLCRGISPDAARSDLHAAKVELGHRRDTLCQQ